MFEIYADTKRRRIVYRDFEIAETRDGWEFCHDDKIIDGIRDDIYACIEAINEWYGE